MTVDQLKVWRIPLLVGCGMALFALVVQLASPVGSQPPQYLWLFSPGLVGDLLVGAGYSPAPVRFIAVLVAIAGFWTVASRLLMIALRRSRERASHSDS
jgi:hypothetical protein